MLETIRPSSRRQSCLRQPDRRQIGWGLRRREHKSARRSRNRRLKPLSYRFGRYSCV